jgi:hypothetical protein
MKEEKSKKLLSPMAGYVQHTSPKSPTRQGGASMKNETSPVQS